MPRVDVIPAGQEEAGDPGQIRQRIARGHQQDGPRPARGLQGREVMLLGAGLVFTAHQEI